jgi:uncharacterized membrane protein YqhA
VTVHARSAGLAGPARILWSPGVGAAAVKQRGKERGVARTKDTTPATHEPGPAASRAQRLLRHLRHTRYLFYFAVGSTLLATALVMLYGTVQIVAFVVELLRHGSISTQWGAELRLTVIEVVDLFLIGTVLFVIAVGLYQLFFTTMMMPLPRWLLVHDVGDLERKLIGLVVTVLSVVFLGQIVTWDGQRDLLGFGVAIGAVIAGLTLFLRHEPRRPPPQDHEQEQPPTRPTPT